MLAKIFKKAPTQKQVTSGDPAIRKLNAFGTRSGVCTVVANAAGEGVQEEVGLCNFYARPTELYSREGHFYLAPPAGYTLSSGLLRGKGETISLQFHHNRIPYAVKCEVVQRVRFTDRLLQHLEPRVDIGFKLRPVSSVTKNENRRSLRFAHVRGIKGPQVAPHFRFDVYAERVALTGSADGSPEILPYPGDDPVPADVQACEKPEELVSLFHRYIQSNPDYLRSVYLSKAEQDPRSGRTEVTPIGSSAVLGLDGEARGTQIHLRRPNRLDGSKESVNLREGDVVILNFALREFVQGADVHHRWVCRVHKSGLKVITVRPKGVIQKQTGLPVVLRDFSVSGACLQNSPLLETYLMGGESVPDDPNQLLSQLEGTGLLLNFYPRMFFQKDLVIYRPDVPPVIPVIGEIVRGGIDTGKDAGRLANYGVTFRFDPADYDPMNYEVRSWEPLRALRENPHFKEVHRALNGLLAYLER
jgi:hypothetical protein